MRAVLAATLMLLAGCAPDSDSPSSLARAEGCAPPLLEGEDAARPLTIPALRLWEPAAGRYALTAQTRIVAAPALAEVARTLAEDLFAQQGRRFDIVADGAADGDIVLARGECDDRLGGEGYLMSIGERMRIEAPDIAGVFYGTRTLLQLLQQSPVIAAGRAADWPRYPQRGLMVDIGRKYFTPAWLHAHVRELAWLKMNYLHLHLSDDQGFRVESTRHPQIVSEQHLSKRELRELIALASAYHITVVPEIDMPGHMEASLAPYPEYQLANVFGMRAPDRLDVTMPEARRFARDLIEEFIVEFPGPYWHTGADELMPPAEYLLHPQLQTYARSHHGPAANGKDAVHDFVNWVDSLVRAHGKTTRMWGDDMNGGSVVELDPGIIVEWWTNFSPLSDPFPPGPQALLDRGHRVMNAGWFPTYYTPLFPDPLPLRPDMRTAYESWAVHEFYGPMVINDPLRFPPERVAVDETRNLGAKLHVWNDLPDAETENEIAVNIAPRLRVIAQKTWESPLLTQRYDDFTAVIEAVGHAPGNTLH